jgi:uncharacterized cofD-like protein
MNNGKNSKIVVIGGGTGVFTVLSGLRRDFKNLTAIVTMADDGGSTGVLREEFGILPPGDVRRAMVALSKTDDMILSELFNYRFKEGKGLMGHSFGNLMLTALSRITGSFEGAIKEASKILSIKGNVVPVSLSKTILFAKLENGKTVRGETNIDIPRHDGNLTIKKVWLQPRARINPRARSAIMAANLVIIGPGDLYTSLIPNMLVSGMSSALSKTKAKIVYFVNITTKFGETNRFAVSDFVRVMEKYAGKDVIDFIAVNSKKPNPARIKTYSRKKAHLVRLDRENLGSSPRIIATDLVRSSGFMRHDPNKISRLVKKILE